MLVVVGKCYEEEQTVDRQAHFWTMNRSMVLK